MKFRTHIGNGEIVEVDSVAPLPIGSCPDCHVEDVILAATGQCAACYISNKNARLKESRFQREAEQLDIRIHAEVGA